MHRVPPAQRAAVPPPPPAKNGPGVRPKTEEFRALLQGLCRAGKRPEGSDEKEGFAGRLTGEALPFEGAATDRPVASRDGEREGEGGFGEGEPGTEAEPMAAELEIEPLTELVVDPFSRALMQAGPPRVIAPEPREPVMVVHPEIEQLLTKLVRRAAFGGDGRRGTARLELGAGPLAGATLLVSAEAGELSIDLELPPGEPAEPWRARISERLSARGLTVRELNVR